MGPSPGCIRSTRAVRNTAYFHSLSGQGYSRRAAGQLLPSGIGMRSDTEVPTQAVHKEPNTGPNRTPPPPGLRGAPQPASHRPCPRCLNHRPRRAQNPGKAVASKGGVTVGPPFGSAPGLYSQSQPPGWKPSPSRGDGEQGATCGAPPQGTTGGRGGGREAWPRPAPRRGRPRFSAPRLARRAGRPLAPSVGGREWLGGACWADLPGLSGQGRGTAGPPAGARLAACHSRDAEPCRAPHRDHSPRLPNPRPPHLSRAPSIPPLPAAAPLSPKQTVARTPGGAAGRGWGWLRGAPSPPPAPAALTLERRKQNGRRFLPYSPRAPRRGKWPPAAAFCAAARRRPRDPARPSRGRAPRDRSRSFPPPRGGCAT